MTMNAWRLDHLGGELRFEEVPTPQVRPGSILVRVEACALNVLHEALRGRAPAALSCAGGRLHPRR
jgi:alcohol dehydrogenase